MMGNQWDTERHKQERVGVIRENNQGYLMKVIEYNNYDDIWIEFQDEFKERKHASWKTFLSGQIRNSHGATSIKDRKNEEGYNKQGLHMVIKTYRNWDDIDVEFDDGYIREHACYSEFINGTIRNHMIPEIYGVGILGDIKTKSNGKFTKEYSTWSNILQRCYDKKKQEKFPKYKGVTICKEWLYYPNFVMWCHNQSNWSKVIGSPKNFHIDKDILLKGNKLYSPDTCCFVPIGVNILFCKADAIRGDYPIGVSLESKGNHFRSRCNNPITGKQIAHSGFLTPESAFEQYKKDKEMIIKQIAEIEYNKGNIIEKCYNAMLNYQVEITD